MPVNRKPTVTTERVASLMLDETLYPRSTINQNWIGRMAEALRAEESLPPIVAERGRRRVIDGFHRHYAYLRVFGPDAETAVEWRTYKDDAAAFKDAAALNARHGEPLTSYDLAHCIQVARRLDIAEEDLPEVLSLTFAKVQQMTAERFGIGPDGQLVLLKRSTRHLAGKKLTKNQVAGNARTSGMATLFHVNQVINALENGIAPFEEDGFLARLRRLAQLISAVDGGATRKTA